MSSLYLLFVGVCVVFIKSSLCDELTYSSQKCEIYRELRKLELTNSDVNTLLCVATKLNFHAANGRDGYWGIYRVNDKWWCGKKRSGGICGFKCSDLLTDMRKNAECARKVFRKNGIDAWALSEECLIVKEEAGLKVCIDENDGVGIGLDVRSTFK